MTNEQDEVVVTRDFLCNLAQELLEFAAAFEVSGLFEMRDRCHKRRQELQRAARDISSSR